MTITKKIAALLTLGASLLGYSAAQAADLPPIYATPIYEAAPELQPVEIGNGWYLRGDVGYGFESDNVYNTNRRFMTGTGFETYTVDEDLQNQWTVGVGAGYRFTDWLRADVTAEWLATEDRYEEQRVICNVFQEEDDVFGVPRPVAYDGSCKDISETDVDIYNYSANAYVDLGTFVGFSPYLGAGLGVANIQSKLKAERHCNEDSIANFGCLTGPQTVEYGKKVTLPLADYEDSTWQPSYSLMAGLGYNVSQNLTFDLGYRYLAIPDFEVFGRSYDDGFDVHQVRAGVRYSLW